MSMAKRVQGMLSFTILFFGLLNLCFTQEQQLFVRKHPAKAQSQTVSQHSMERAVQQGHSVSSKREAMLKDITSKGLLPQAKSHKENNHGRTSTPARFIDSRSGGVKSPMNDIANFIIMENVDMASCGYGGMRDGGEGFLTLSFSTPPASIIKAYLYWNGPTNSLDPNANAQVVFNGDTVTGINIGFSDDNCWDYVNSQAYRADVTEYIDDTSSTYSLSNFVKDNGNININGVSLLVFYDDGNAGNNHDYVVFDGNDSNIENEYDSEGWNVQLTGISYTEGSASMIMHVADGQIWEDDNIYINGSALTDSNQLFDGNTVPFDTATSINKKGSLWDILNFDISSYLVPGLNNVQVKTGVNNDCLSLVLVLLELPVGSAPSEFGTAKIEGMVFHDENQNGLKDDFEEDNGLKGWSIVLSGAASETTKTNPNGKYTFANLLPGSYTVSEILETNWNQTMPEAVIYNVTVDSGEIVDDIDFGNYPEPASVYGSKWNDLNGNGDWDTDEHGLENWKIYLSVFDYDIYDFVHLDSTFTDPTGAYEFHNLPYGYLYLTEEDKEGWEQKFPSSGYHYINITEPGQTENGYHFGNMPLPSDLIYEPMCRVFPTVRPGEQSTLPVTISNPGLVSIEILGVETTTANFSAELDGSSTIPGGNSTTVLVTFSPYDSGEYAGLVIVTTSAGSDTIMVGGQGELPATGDQQEIFAGLATAGGDLVPKNSIVSVWTLDMRLIKLALVQIPPDSIVDNINYTISLQEGQAGIKAGDTLMFGISTSCDLLLERVCSLVTFAPGFPPVGGYVTHDIDGVEPTVVSIPLRQGYNAVSWNVMPENPAVTSVFSSILYSNKVKIILDYINDGVTNQEYNFYIPALGEYNPLQITDFRKGYFVRMNEASDEPLSIFGQPVCSYLPIPVNSGYNFISYLPDESIEVEDALQSLLPDNLNIALNWTFDSESGEGRFDFYPNGGFEMMEKGNGYFVKVDLPAYLMYPESGGDDKSADVQPQTQSISSTNFLPEAVFAYGKQLTIDGTLIPKGTEIKAIDRDGVVCGFATFIADGVVALPISADNPQTIEDEGAERGEYVKLYLNSRLLNERIQWTEFGDTPELKGNLAVLATDEIETTPKEFTIHQNYPNPFNPVTSISYELPSAAHVRIAVYDMLGQEVRTLMQGKQDAGHYSLTWDGTNENGISMSSGMYTCRLTAENGTTNFVRTVKMTLLK